MSHVAFPKPQNGELLRQLGLFDTMSLVVGTVIGSGIFLVPAEVARSVPTPVGMLAVWVFGGVFTLLGALSLAELGAAIPQAGGIYTYIARGFGPLAGFLCGWMLFTVATSGSIATLAVALPIYVSALIPMTPVAAKAVSLAAVLAFTAINVRGVRSGALVQNVLTTLKIGGLLGMIAVIFLLTGERPRAAAAAAPDAPVGIAAFGVALVAVLWAYEGWHDVSFAAGEIRQPQRNFPRGLVAGTAIVIGLYLTANLAYLRVLTPSEIAGSQRVALTAMERVAGVTGGKLLTAAIVCSILGALNALVLAGPRAYYQMARDGLFLEPLARVHPRWKTPVAAILLQAVWSCCLILFIGGFSQLFTYVIFGGWIFYALAVVSVIALRKKEPALHRPFRVPGYPVVPALFAAAAAAMVGNTLLARPRESLIGLAFIALGVPVFFLRRALLARREG
ncbi:MAG TPA: amino acid permease [Thermoanaerobaculia bacterium]|nr:amino acid permease [Thermoanaerobaculia bacterium]